MGTVTTLSSELVKEIGSMVAEWNYVEVISGDPTHYRAQGEQMALDLANQGLSSEYAYAYDTDWNQIVDLLDQLRIKKRRVIFVLGTESYFRKVICASIMVGSNTGISWLSQGTWRDGWWKTTDALMDSYRQWMEEDSRSHSLKEAMTDFRDGWQALPGTDEEKFNMLRPLYFTDLKEALEFVPSATNDLYHANHKKWHPTYRDLQTSRNYNDIYIMDIKGNVIYSVFKDLDFATNLGTLMSSDKKYVEWQSSGLGHIFREALADVNVLSVSAHWEPYGPLGGQLASFMAMAVKDVDNLNTLGVFASQMPPEAMSIEDVQAECSLAAIADKFEGAINFVGLGKPIKAELGRQVPCFSGRTAEAFLELLDVTLKHGYDDDATTAVEQPFSDLKAHPADAACVFAYAVKHLIGAGFKMADIKNNDESVYTEFIDYIKGVEFQGVSGFIRFTGNDKPAHLGVYQVREGHNVLVGTCSHNGTKDFDINGGPSNASWKPAHPDQEPPPDDFPFWAIQIFLPLLCICCPAIAACVANF
jgi:hypothetical protein